MQNLIGQTLLNQFRVDEFISAGGMGVVYRVWDIKRGVPLAMKVLSIDPDEDDTAFRMFEREAKMLQELTHPNIVPFFGLYHTDDFAFLLEQYIDGSTLKDVLKGGRQLPLEEAFRYLQPICTALGYAHANGVVHCDIKPGNILIDRSNRVYLADFGIVRHAESTSTSFGPAGTPAYMAPEQITGKKVSQATDVYALGILAYEMLAGRRPFKGDEDVPSDLQTATVNERLRYAHTHIDAPDPRQFNPAIPEELGRVILKALEKEPGKRFADARTFYEAAAAAVDAQTVPPGKTIRFEEETAAGRTQAQGPGPATSTGTQAHGATTYAQTATSTGTMAQGETPYEQPAYRPPVTPVPPMPQPAKKGLGACAIAALLVGLGGVAVVGLIIIIVLISSNGSNNGAAYSYPTATQYTSQQSGSSGSSSSQSPTATRYVEPPTSTPNRDLSCPGADWQPRVEIGQTVSVCTIYRLIVREHPGSDYNEIMAIYPGARLTITDGPKCGSNYWWWEVKVPVSTKYSCSTCAQDDYKYTSSEIVGWVREGLDRAKLPDTGGYFLCP
jgi:serine/threonine protein kinase